MQKGAQLDRATFADTLAKMQTATVSSLQQPGLASYMDVRHLPLATSTSNFTALQLRGLPGDIEDLRAAPVPMLDTRGDRVMQALQERKSARTSDSKLASTQAGIHTALGKELIPLLSLQSVLALSADVHGAIQAAKAAKNIEPDELLAVIDTAHYLTAWSQGLVAARIGEISAYLQYDADKAARWAAQSYGPQNTLMGASPAAAAFQLACSAEAKPTPAPSRVFTMRDGASGGRGGGRAGGRGRTPPAEQHQSGHGTREVPARVS